MAIVNSKLLVYQRVIEWASALVPPTPLLGVAVETEIAVAWVARGKCTEIAVAWVAPGRWTEGAMAWVARAAWVAPGSCRGGFGEFCGLANGSLERP